MLHSLSSPGVAPQRSSLLLWPLEPCLPLTHPPLASLVPFLPLVPTYLPKSTGKPSSSKGQAWRCCFPDYRALRAPEPQCPREKIKVIKPTPQVCGHDSAHGTLPLMEEMLSNRQLALEALSPLEISSASTLSFFPSNQPCHLHVPSARGSPSPPPVFSPTSGPLHPHLAPFLASRFLC